MVQHGWVGGNHIELVGDDNNFLEKYCFEGKKHYEHLEKDGGKDYEQCFHGMGNDIPRCYDIMAF